MISFVSTLVVVAFLAAFSSVNCFRFVQPKSKKVSLWSHGVHEDGKTAVNSPKGNSVSIYKSADSLATAVCNDFILSAQNAITRSGRFYVAVPGGSVLKMLGGLKEMGKEVDWSKVFLFYVNHKCVPNDDASATHFKALSIFLDACPANAFSMTEAAVGITKGHDTDAHLYRSQIETVLPQHDGLPIFDYMLLGMGKDGHIGSLYPGRKEVLMTDKHQWVLSVDKKSPSSISLSLPVMNAAREVRVVLSGADKAEAVLSGVIRDKSAYDFPVCGVKSAQWMVDESAAALLIQSNEARKEADKVECLTF